MWQTEPVETEYVAPEAPETVTGEDNLPSLEDVYGKDWAWQKYDNKEEAENVVGITLEAPFFGNEEYVTYYASKGQERIRIWYLNIIEDVDKCTVLRVRYYDALGRSETCMESYFVGFSQKQGYEGYPVLSLIMDPKGLTDGETGIYIQGDTYDGNSWSGNYNQRGRDWERLAYFQYFRPEGELQTASSCGVRIKGNWSRRLPQKSLNLFARKQYSGQKEFMYDFWGDGYFPDVMTLHAGGNDTSGKLKNRLAAELCRETLETLRQEQASAMAAHYRRWYSTTPEAFFDETEEYLAFFENRPRVIRQLLWQYDLLPKDTAP